MNTTYLICCDDSPGRVDDGRRHRRQIGLSIDDAVVREHFRRHGLQLRVRRHVQHAEDALHAEKLALGFVCAGVWTAAEAAKADAGLATGGATVCVGAVGFLYGFFEATYLLFAKSILKQGSFQEGRCLRISFSTT